MKTTKKTFNFSKAYSMDDFRAVPVKDLPSAYVQDQNGEVYHLSGGIFGCAKRLSDKAWWGWVPNSQDFDAYFKDKKVKFIKRVDPPKKATCEELEATIAKKNEMIRVYKEFIEDVSEGRTADHPPTQWEEAKSILEQVRKIEEE